MTRSSFLQLTSAFSVCKQAGLKFTFGSDARNENAGRFVYCIEMARLCGLQPSDMFTIPERKL
jgi:hypothetical protein